MNDPEEENGCGSRNPTDALFRNALICRRIFIRSGAAKVITAPEEWR